MKTLICLVFLSVLISASLKADVFTKFIPKEEIVKSPAEGDRPPVQEPISATREESVEASVDAEVKEAPKEEKKAQTVRACHLRSMPTDNSVPVKVIPKGTEVTVKPVNKNWLQIEGAFMAGTCLR